MLCFIAATICLFPDMAKLDNKQMQLCKVAVDIVDIRIIFLLSLMNCYSVGCLPL